MSSVSALQPRLGLHHRQSQRSGSITSERTVGKTVSDVFRAADTPSLVLQRTAASLRDKHHIPCHRSGNASWSCCVFANKIKKRVCWGGCQSNCFYGDYSFLFGVTARRARKGRNNKNRDEQNARQPRLQPKAISSSKFSYAKPMGIINIW